MNRHNIDQVMYSLEGSVGGSNPIIREILTFVASDTPIMMHSTMLIMKMNTFLRQHFADGKRP